jgi:RHS repeat-associated protein
VLEHFDDDANGNRTAANLGGAAQSCAYPSTSHRLQSINGISRDYDNVGNTTRRDGLNYRYNGRNGLSQVSSGRTTFYAASYNARGEREEKTVMAGMTTLRFLYDEAGRLIQTGNVPRIGLTRTLKPEQRLLWLDDQLVGVKIKATSGAYAGELLYAHTDHLGTPRALSRASNNSVVWRWPLETSAFGQHPAQTDPDGDGQALTFNLRYPGQYFDSESGLHYNYFRDYEAGVGRYIESDPIGFEGGISTCAYVYSSSLIASDAVGLAAAYGLPGTNETAHNLGEGGSICVTAAAGAYSTAGDEARSTQLPGAHNGPQDAVRHCIWICKFARVAGSSCARAVGNNHEMAGQDRGDPLEELEMDWANNAQGIQCASEDNEDNCKARCMNRYLACRLSGLGGARICTH